MGIIILSEISSDSLKSVEISVCVRVGVDLYICFFPCADKCLDIENRLF